MCTYSMVGSDEFLFYFRGPSPFFCHLTLRPFEGLDPTKLVLSLMSLSKIKDCGYSCIFCVKYFVICTILMIFRSSSRWCHFNILKFVFIASPSSSQHLEVQAKTGRPMSENCIWIELHVLLLKFAFVDWCVEIWIRVFFY